MEKELMHVQYQDTIEGIRVIGYADTLIVDTQTDTLVGIRVGGYPEVVRALSTAINGGGTIIVRTDARMITCVSEPRHYCSTLSHEGSYTVATILWNSNAVWKEKTNGQRRLSDDPRETDHQESEDNHSSSDDLRTYYLLCAQQDHDTLYQEIDRYSTVPMIPNFKNYLIEELWLRDILTPCSVYTTRESFEAWRLICSQDDQNIAEVITDGLRDGRIQIPGANLQQAQVFQEITGVTSYLNAFGSALASRIRGQFDPLYDPTSQALSDEVLMLNQFIKESTGYSLYPAQLAAAEAIKCRLHKGKFCLLIAECGSGKSKTGALSLQAYFLKQNRKAFHIVLSPAHISGKWIRELDETIPNSLSALVRSPEDLDALYAEYEQGDRTVFAVISKESARDGYMRRPAVCWNQRKKGFVCPDCGHIIQMTFLDCGRKSTIKATSQYFQAENRENHFCDQCGAVLWTATTADEQSEWVRISHLGYVHRRFVSSAIGACKTQAAYKQLAALAKDSSCFIPTRGAHRRVPLSAYIKSRYSGKIDGLIADELHLYAANSGQGDAMGELFAAAKKCIGMTATLINGYASGIFHLLYRMCSHLMQMDGQRYLAPSRFAQEYGVIENVYEVSEGGYNSNRRTVKRKKRSRQHPGVSPLVYSRFLLENAVFLSLLDMGKELPEYEEIPVSLEFPPSQQEEYSKIEQAFENLFKDRSHTGLTLAQKLLSTYMNLLMAYPDQPYGHKPLVNPFTNEILFTPKDAGSPVDHTEKDKRTLEIIQQKLANGERVLLYVNWVRLDSRTRLLATLHKNGIRAEIMDETVKPLNREQWVNEHLKSGMQVLITNPNLVETGLDLNEFTTLIFYDIAFKLFTFRQASRRSWRINQTAPRIEVYILYYHNTMQARAVRLMASKLAVASIFEGSTMTDEGLAAMSESEDMMSALAKELAAGIRHDHAVEDISASFRKMAVLHESKNVAPNNTAMKQKAYEPISTSEQISLWELAS